MASSTPDGELVPTQQLNYASNFSLWDEDSPNVHEHLELSETKASQIRKHISSLTPDNRTSNAAKVIRCQCSWNGEEPDMVRVCYLMQLSQANCAKRSSVRSAILINTLSVMVSQTPRTPDFRKFMLVIDAS